MINKLRDFTLVQRALISLLFRKDAGEFLALPSTAEDEFFYLAEQHRVVPSLYACISEILADEKGGNTAALRTRIETAARRHACVSLETIAVAHQVSAVLHESNISHAVLRGIANAVLLYGGTHRRHTGDVDLLVSQADLPLAVARVVALGYRPLRAPQANKVVLQHEEKNVSVDLHAAILEPRFRFHWDVVDILRRTGQIRAAPTNLFFPIASPEDALLIDCLHALKHMWCKLIWLLDFARALERYDEAVLEAAVRKAIELRVERSLLLAVALVELLTEKPPPYALGRLFARGAPIHSFAYIFLARLFSAAGAAAKLQNVALQSKILNEHVTTRQLLTARALSRCCRVFR